MNFGAGGLWGEYDGTLLLHVVLFLVLGWVFAGFCIHVRRETFLGAAAALTGFAWLTVWFPWCNTADLHEAANGFPGSHMTTAATLLAYGGWPVQLFGVLVFLAIHLAQLFAFVNLFLDLDFTKEKRA